jgi:hypothetical protein
MTDSTTITPIRTVFMLTGFLFPASSKLANTVHGDGFENPLHNDFFQS